MSFSSLFWWVDFSNTLFVYFIVRSAILFILILLIALAVCILCSYKK